MTPLQPGAFIFSTGIECSYPTITGADGRTIRVDQLEKTFHYTRWREDLRLTRELGLRCLRYGPPYHRVHTAAHTFEWQFVDDVFAELRRLEIEPIVDLCHFGVPDWIGDFQNPDFPEQFARYAAAFAARYPWVRFYTPVNEIYVCARLSALHGLWNERQKSDRAFVTAVSHLCRANLLGVREILRLRPDAVFIQSESAEQFHAATNDPDCVARADFENERRFLPFDLLFGHQPSGEMTLYLLDNGMPREDFGWFMRQAGHGLADRIVVGNDYYERNEQLVTASLELKPAGEVFGWAPITRQYYDRYRRPVMHTETNTISSSFVSAADAPRWLWKEFFNVRHLRSQGIPVIGFTWYSLIDQVDWDSALSLDRGVVNPVGLFDLDRNVRPVGEAYRQMIREFSDEPLVAGAAVFALGGPTPGPSDTQPRPHPQHTVEGRGALPERSIVAIARTEDESIDDAGIDRLVREAVDCLGGMGRFVKPGQTVLIKPNLTVFRLAADGCTTDPRVVAALARLAREAGAAKVQVGECSSCGQVTREIMSTTGMERLAVDAGAEPVYFDEVEQVEIDVPRGKLIHRIPVPRPLLEADVVIDCPKLKTHFLDPVTCAIKNWVGAARQDTMHRLHRDQVEETVADLLTVTRPDLVVTDALVAGEGNGPVANTSRFVGCVLASDDPVAHDVIAADLAGFDGESLRFVRAAASRGVGIDQRARIDVRGAPLDTARVRLKPSQSEGWMERYPIRIIAGEGVTMEGTLGHFRGFADFWQDLHSWDAVVKLKGRPTFMIGRAEDPDFEAHVKEGRYFVLDDVALDTYRKDPRVVFIPGSPIGNEMMPVILKELGVEIPGKSVQKMLEAWAALRARWQLR
ncbi:MAG TPA: family 1 glycosylhydrolase [Chloroflexota bacterium]|nr:family 1 glycosylhydrolase [Chloroflexota bacterium]